MASIALPCASYRTASLYASVLTIIGAYTTGPPRLGLLFWRNIPTTSAASVTCDDEAQRGQVRDPSASAASAGSHDPCSGYSLGLTQSLWGQVNKKDEQVG